MANQQVNRLSPPVGAPNGRGSWKAQPVTWCHVQPHFIPGLLPSCVCCLCAVGFRTAYRHNVELLLLFLSSSLFFVGGCCWCGVVCVAMGNGVRMDKTTNEVVPVNLCTCVLSLDVVLISGVSY